MLIVEEIASVECVFNVISSEFMVGSVEVDKELVTEIVPVVDEDTKVLIISLFDELLVSDKVFATFGNDTVDVMGVTETVSVDCVNTSEVINASRSSKIQRQTSHK